jgi:hypothetical protein
MREVFGSRACSHHIQQNHVWIELASLVHCFNAVSGFSYNFHVGLGVDECPSPLRATAVPPVLLALSLAIALEPSFRTMIIVVGALLWSNYCCQVRGDTLAMRAELRS